MSGLLGSITGAIGRLFGNFWGDPTPPELPKPSEPPVPEEEPESDGESDYSTADEGDMTSEEDSESDNESEPEEDDKIIFRRIEDPAPKRLVETRRISDQGLCVDHLTIIPETYSY
jgi:hypothetical protein